MSERDEEAVVARVAMAVGGYDETDVRSVLLCLRPGDRLPGRGVWVPVEQISEWDRQLRELYDGIVAIADEVIRVSDGKGVDQSAIKDELASFRAMITAASEESQ